MRELANRFWKYVEVTPTCWLWQGGEGRGYGRFDLGRNTLTGRHRMIAAHRYIYELVIGPLRDDEHLNHTCHGRGCVNPSHLRVERRKPEVKRELISAVIIRRPLAEREARRVHQRIWRANNRHKARTHLIVHRAVGRGLLTRQPCEVCGATTVHAHHHRGYEFPLDVQWLCPRHHNERHGRARKG